MQIMQHKRNITLGEVYIVSTPEIVWTVLGSCVAIVLYHPKLKKGAICHAQLPHQLDKAAHCEKECPRKCNREKQNGVLLMKYLDCSFNFMIARINEMGLNTSELQAHLYGGGNSLSLVLQGKTVGEQNILLAKELLKKHHIEIVEQDVLGNLGRKIFFDFNSNKSTVHYL